MHGKGKIVLDVSKALSHLKVKKVKKHLWINGIENGRISAFLASNAFAKEVEIDLRCTRQIFLERLTTSLRDG